jgi:GDP-L-fucose synthase
MSDPKTIRPSDYWSAKRVIVTGGRGFLGSFVTEKLIQRGATDILVPRVEDYDLTDHDSIRRLLDDALSPDVPVQLRLAEEIARSPKFGMHPSDLVILHLAAHVGGIGANREHPAEFFYDNLMMGVELMHQAWQRGVGKFVAIGTVCAYPKFTPVPFREDDIWNGYPEETNAPYGLAKKMLLVQAQAYRQQYGFNAIYLLPVNLYGPRITTCSSPSPRSSAGRWAKPVPHELVAWGDGSPTREFLYVEDAAAGILDAAEKYDGHEPVNLGSGNEISIRDLTELIIRLTGFEGGLIWDTSKPNGQPRRGLDVSRAERYFGWKAQVSFEDGLRRTIEWYRQNGQKGS